jgi:hypothetical protein
MVVMAALTERGNLDARAREGQLRVGLAALGMALVLSAFLCRPELGADAGYRAIVFVPFFVASYGVLAAFYRTCGLSAIAGHRRTPDGTEPVADRAELASQRRTGAMVMLMSVGLAGAATLLFVIAR